MQHKMDWFVVYRVGLTTAVTRVDDLHQACCNRSTAYVLQYSEPLKLSTTFSGPTFFTKMLESNFLYINLRY